MDRDASVFVVSGFEPLQRGLAEAIHQQADLSLLGVASNLTEAMRDVRFAEADVLVIDPAKEFGTTQENVQSSFEESLPGRKVVILGDPESMRSPPPDAILPLLIEVDGLGYMAKDGPTSRLIDTVRLVAAGAFVCESSVMKPVLLRLLHGGSNRHGEQLSERQAEILSLVAHGHSNKEIALMLSLSESTVKAHISLTMSKLGLTRRTELVRWALTDGRTNETAGVRDGTPPSGLYESPRSQS